MVRENSESSLRLRMPDFVNTDRLKEVLEDLKDPRPLKRGPDGFEVVTFVLPMRPEEAVAIVTELLARRKGHS